MIFFPFVQTVLMTSELNVCTSEGNANQQNECVNMHNSCLQMATHTHTHTLCLVLVCVKGAVLQQLYHVMVKVNSIMY